MKKTSTWTREDAAEYYGIRSWGAGYFDISEQGDIVARAAFGENGEQQVEVSLADIVEGLRERGLEMPVQLRIENVLDSSVAKINRSFARAIATSGYKGEYRGVFPIKVNQQRHVVQDLVRCGKPYHHGLEAGSKAELLVAMASLTDPECLIICNGYKDEEFITLGLYARQLGMKCIFVAETVAELSIIIARSRAMDITPMIGLRLKLATQVAGRWQSDSGDRSMFGLTTLEIIAIIDRLKQDDMLQHLELLHYHLGSQIADIRSIREGAREACRYYIDLIREGAPLGYLDLGGGLAVDYDGSNSSTEHSRNYSLDEYSVDIIEAVQESLNSHNIPHPTIVTESGRATVAYCSVLLFNVLGVSNFDPLPVADTPAEISDEHVRTLWQVLQDTTPKRVQESYNDARYYRDLLRLSFKRGTITLRERAVGENIYLAIVQKILHILPDLPRVPTELEQLPEKLSDIYYGNLSIFQSLPDSWAIQQIFPIAPIHRLLERPTRQAIIADLTCDCDGKIDRFVTSAGAANTLALHALKEQEEYYLGVFLTGAYQETLGDLHNLFGDTNVASVRINEDGSHEFIHELEGDRIADVLSYVEFDTAELYQQFRSSAEAAVRRRDISVKQRQSMLAAFSESLRGYTYFES